MKALNLNFGQTRLWWLIVLVGILLVLGGFAYWFWPVAGYAVASQLFGWLLILAGIIQLCVAAGPNTPRGWGWWIAGGVINMFVGFMMVRSILLSELVMPYFLAFIFIFWGLEAIVSISYRGTGKYWWLNLINGILLCLIGFFFLEAGYLSDMWMTSFLASIAFIYWGFTVAMTGYTLKPYNDK
ncbi:MAG: DUF308 domain-containing protein [Muribaculaceae bacterium]|nr:DUF308 domain-containing protein [Muribaculaceae bacterium]